MQKVVLFFNINALERTNWCFQFSNAEHLYSKRIQEKMKFYNLFQGTICHGGGMETSQQGTISDP